MSFFAALWARPAELSPLSTYIVANGCLYLVLGVGLLVGAGPVGGLLEAVEGTRMHDLGMVRVAGMMLAIIGWFYVMGGRTGATSFALATVADRAVVPFVLIPLWWFGELPASIAWSFALLDPALAFGAWWLWRRAGPP
jgi:hypothetical protein